MIVAVLSDIHGNLEALEAVAGELDRRRAEAVWHLGDVAGYNADVEPCARWVMARASECVAGNHDAVAAGTADGARFHPPARQAALWARERLSDASRAWLAALPARRAVPGGILLVHGAPSDPDRYVFSLDDAADELEGLPGGRSPRLVLFGHTHIPFAVVRKGDGEIAPVRPVRFVLAEGETAMLNPGSVGQPRDRDPRAAFLLLDTARMEAEWVRVPYDVEGCRRKVLAAGLPRFFASRLAEGT